MVMQAERAMTKAQACKVLQVSSTADAEIVTQAYWHLARKYRADGSRDARARKRLAELEEAFALLHPAPLEALAPDERGPAARLSEEPPLAQEFVTWLRQLAGHTTVRWRGRVPEIAIIGAAAVFLAFLALSAGASGLLTLLALGVALVTVLSPWRRA